MPRLLTPAALALVSSLVGAVPAISQEEGKAPHPTHPVKSCARAIAADQAAQTLDAKVAEGEQIKGMLGFKMANAFDPSAQSMFARMIAGTQQTQQRYADLATLAHGYAAQQTEQCEADLGERL